MQTERLPRSTRIRITLDGVPWAGSDETTLGNLYVMDCWEPDGGALELEAALIAKGRWSDPGRVIELVTPSPSPTSQPPLHEQNHDH